MCWAALRLMPKKLAFFQHFLLFFLIKERKKYLFLIICVQYNHISPGSGSVFLHQPVPDPDPSNIDPDPQHCLLGLLTLISSHPFFYVVHSTSGLRFKASEMINHFYYLWKIKIRVIYALYLWYTFVMNKTSFSLFQKFARVL